MITCSTWPASSLDRNGGARDKRSSLFGLVVIDEKKFYNIDTCHHSYKIVRSY